MRVGVAVVAVWWLSVAAGQKKDWGGVEDSLVLLLDARFYTGSGTAHTAHPAARIWTDQSSTKNDAVADQLTMPCVLALAWLPVINIGWR